MNIKNWLYGTIATCSLMLTGCNNSKGDLSDCENYVFTDSVSNSYIYGFVSDVDGNALANVLVTSGKDTTVTSENGAYSFDRCRAVNGRCVIKFEENEYFSVVRTADIDNGEARVDAVLMPQDTKEGVTEITRFYNSQGATIKVGNMQITIPANSLVYENDGKPFYGSVFASAYYLNPNSENFTKEMPGGDMSGVTVDGKSVILLSYGMVEVTLKDSVNKKLQLKEGAESTLSFPIPEGFTENQKYNEIPLWYFDDEKGTWVEEGIATKNGDSYSGKIKHFSWHNLDYPSKRASICGRVINKKGQPLPNVLVTISQTSARTDKNGNYCAFVPKNTPVFVTVKPSDYANCPNMPIYNVDGLEAETIFNQDIVLPNMPCIHGKVTDKNEKPISGININSNNVTTQTNNFGEYTLYINGNEPISVSVDFLTLDKDLNETMSKSEYEFNDPSEIEEDKSYDFTIDRPIKLSGWINLSNNNTPRKPFNVTVNINNKEFNVKSSSTGIYSFLVSSDVKEVTAYVKADDAYGVESNKSSKTINSEHNRYYNYLPPITVLTGVTVNGYITNTCGASKANVTIESGRGKDKKIFSQSTKYGYFEIYLPLDMIDSKAKVKINCQGKKITKKINLDKKEIDLGNTEFCSGDKPEPDCIYAIIGDQTVKFDTKKDRYTEMFQKDNKTQSHKYQAWYKSPDFNGTLVLEIISYPEFSKETTYLSVYLITDNISASKEMIYTPRNEKNIYTFKTDYELYNEKNNDDDEIFLYGSAEIENKSINNNFIDTAHISKRLNVIASKILVGKNNSTKFQTLTLPKSSTKNVENILKKSGFVEKETFMDDEQRFSSIYIQDNAEALIHRNKDNTSDVTILTREGIDKQPLYQCWKVDFKNSSLKGKGKSVDYMWKNEADIAQLVMFGPIMGVKFTKTDITEQKCGCSTGNGPTVAN